MGGAIYTLQSSAHMVVQSHADKVLVGFALVIIASAIGWLSSYLVPTRASPASGRDETGAAAPGDSPPDVHHPGGD